MIFARLGTAVFPFLVGSLAETYGILVSESHYLCMHTDALSTGRFTTAEHCAVRRDGSVHS